MQNTFGAVTTGRTAAEVGQRVEFECTPPASNPPPSVTWFRSDIQVVTSDASDSSDLNARVQRAANGYGLVITSVLIQDRGQYRCEAVNPVTKSRALADSVSLDVFRMSTRCFDCFYFLLVSGKYFLVSFLLGVGGVGELIWNAGGAGEILDFIADWMGIYP